MGILCSSSDTSISTTTDDIDTVIAKKREVINIKKSRQKFAARNSRTGNGRISSQDSGEYVKQTIESAREALISSTSNSSSDSDDFEAENPVIQQSTNALDNPPRPNSEAEVDKNMHREILEALKTEIEQNELDDSSDSEPEVDKNMHRKILETLKTESQQNENNESSDSDTDQTSRYVVPF